MDVEPDARWQLLSVVVVEGAWVVCVCAFVQEYLEVEGLGVEGGVD